MKTFTPDVEGIDFYPSDPSEREALEKQKEEWFQEAITSGEFVLLIISSNICVPCRKLEADIEEHEEEFPEELEIVVIASRLCPRDHLQKYNISSVPKSCFYYNGKLVRFTNDQEEEGEEATTDTSVIFYNGYHAMRWQELCQTATKMVTYYSAIRAS